MTSKRRIAVGVVASLAVIASGVACSDSGDKRAVADSSGSNYRSNDSMTTVSNQPGMATATVSPTYPNHTTQDNSYSGRTSYDADAPRPIVRVSATDPEIAGTTATATYDAAPQTTVTSTRNGSTMTVQEAPPLTPPELAPTPTADQFWVDGNWQVENNRYVWKPGHLENRRSNELYHPAKWTQTDQGWEFTPAYWD